MWLGEATSEERNFEFKEALLPDSAHGIAQFLRRSRGKIRLIVRRYKKVQYFFDSKFLKTLLKVYEKLLLIPVFLMSFSIIFLCF